MLNGHRGRKIDAILCKIHFIFSFFQFEIELGVLNEFIVGMVYGSV